MELNYFYVINIFKLKYRFLKKDFVDFVVG